MKSASARKPFLIPAPLTELGLRAERSIVRHERKYLLCALTVFTLLALYHALTAPLWLDELFTFFISRISSLPEMLRAMPADGQPPLQYLLTHLSLRLFGITEFTIRLPELLAYMATGLLTYKIVRRHGTAIQALFALAMLLGAAINMGQAYTARPYELMIAFTTLTFYSWQTAALREHHRFMPQCGVALGIAGAILSHHFGVIHVGLMLAAGEIVRLIERRRLDGWMLAAIAAGLSSLVLTVPMMHQSRLMLGDAILHSTNFCCKPSPLNLLSYLWMIAIPLLCLIAVFTSLRWSRDSATGHACTSEPVPTHEWAAAGALSLLVPALILLTAITTHYFLIRYAVSCSLGLALLGGWALPRLAKLRLITQPLLALSTLCYLLLTATTLLLENLNQPIWNALPSTEGIFDVLLHAPGGLPIVVANAFDYAADWWYAPPSLKERLVYLSDVPYAIQQSDFLPELSLVRDQAYIPISTSDYAAFVESHPHFLLLRSGLSSRNWTETRLADSGWRLTPIAKSGVDVLFQVDRP
jgi:hypothetical protein